MRILLTEDMLLERTQTLFVLNIPYVKNSEASIIQFSAASDATSCRTACRAHVINEASHVEYVTKMIRRARIADRGRAGDHIQGTSLIAETCYVLYCQACQAPVQSEGSITYVKYFSGLLTSPYNLSVAQRKE